MSTWRAILLALATGVVVTVMICFAASTEWVGKPFGGFLLGRNGIVAPIGLAHWTGFRADIPLGSQLVESDGHAVAGVANLVEEIWQTPVDTPRRYAFDTGSGRVERTIPVMRFTLLDYLLLFGLWIVNGVPFLALGFVVAYLKPGRPVGVATLVFGVAWGLTLLLSLGDFYRFYFRSLYAVAQAVAPAALVFVALTFPDRPLPRRWPLLVGGFAVLTALHAGADIWLYERNPALWMRFFEVSLVYMALCAVASCLLLAQSYARLSHEVRARLTVIGVGAVAAFGLPAAVHLAAVLADVQLPLNLLPGVTAIFAVAVGYAILKHDVLSLDPLLTRSVFYVCFSGFVLVSYVALLGLASAAQPVQASGASAWVPFIFALGVVAVVAPIRRAAQALVNRLFFRTHYDVEAALEEVSRSLTVCLDRDEIAAGVHRTLATTVAPDPCLLLLPEGDGRMVDAKGRAISIDDSFVYDLPGLGAEVLSLASLPVDAGPLEAAGVSLVVPLRSDHELEGLLALGPKKSGALYGARDLALLRTLGNQAAIALRNAASYAAVRELTTTLELRVAERTADLEKTHGELLATQDYLARADKLASLGRLVAGVAHEINNPVAFVSSSVDLIHEAAVGLRRGLDGSAEPRTVAAIEKLLENAAICRDGALRAARIVRDLTAFSRASGVQRESIDLATALDRTLQLLRGETRDRIDVVRRYGAVPSPWANAGEIDQVFMNLISNAVQAIEATGEIRLVTYAQNGSAFIEVQDSGHGVPLEIQGQIFEPFFTTKTGGGTGLGLAISQAIVARHAGDLLLHSTAGRGTTFIVRLPIEPPPQPQPRVLPEERR